LKNTFKKIAQSFKKKVPQVSKEPKGLYWQFLGGNNTKRIGANCGLLTFTEENDQGKKQTTRLLFDCGSLMGDTGSPEDPSLVNCDTVIPDLTECFEKKDSTHKPSKKVDAIFLTHSHTDHIEALPLMVLIGYELPAIYATPFTAKRLYQAFSNQNIDPELWPAVTEIAPGQNINYAGVKVTPFSVSHSTPQSVGFYIETAEGNIVQPGDFKLDQTLSWGPGFNREQFDRIVKNGVDLLLLDSTGSDKNIKPITEAHVRKTLSKLMKENDNKRFVIACMGGFEESIASIAKVASKFDRNVWGAGWSHEQALSALKQTGLSLSDYIGQDVNIRTLSGNKAVNDLKAAKPGSTVVLVTGAQGKQNAVLTRAADHKSSILDLKKSRDIILFCSPSIPGMEKAIRDRLITSLKKQGFTVYTNMDLPLYSHGHGRMPELLEFSEIAKPKKIIPVHGCQKLRDANTKALNDKGFKTLDALNGDVIKITKRSVKKALDLKEKQRLIGFKTRSGYHWKDRDYFVVFAPQAEKISNAEKEKSKGKRQPQVFIQHPRRK